MMMMTWVTGCWLLYLPFCYFEAPRFQWLSEVRCAFAPSFLGDKVMASADPKQVKVKITESGQSVSVKETHAITLMIRRKKRFDIILSCSWWSWGGWFTTISDIIFQLGVNFEILWSILHQENRCFFINSPNRCSAPISGQESCHSRRFYTGSCGGWEYTLPPLDQELPEGVEGADGKNVWSATVYIVEFFLRDACEERFSNCIHI